MDYDINPIQAYTAYTYKELKDFQKFTMRHSRVLFTVLFILWMLVFLLYILGISDSRSTFDSFMLYPTVFFTIMFLTANGVFYTRKANDINNRHMKNGEFFVFRNFDFSVSSEQSDYRCKVDMRYDFLYSFHETKDMFYLYISPRLAYLVSKHGFQNGCPEALSALLNTYVTKQDIKRKGSSIKIYLIILLVLMLITFLLGYLGTNR